MNDELKLLEEKEQLQRELQSLKTATENKKARKFTCLVSRYYLVGRDVKKSTKSLIQKYRQEPSGDHDMEIAETISAIVKRVAGVYLFIAILAFLPVTILSYQAYLLYLETDVLENHNAELSEEKELEKVTIFSTSFEDKDIVVDFIDNDDSGFLKKEVTTPGKKLKIIVMNNTRLPVLLEALKVEIVDDGIRRIPDPRTRNTQLVEGMPLGDLRDGIYYLNPGEGGNEFADIDLVAQPAKATVIQCYIPMPLVEKSGTVNFRCEVVCDHSNSKTANLVFHHEAIAEKELVIGAKKIDELLRKTKDQ